MNWDTVGLTEYLIGWMYGHWTPGLCAWPDIRQNPDTVFNIRQDTENTAFNILYRIFSNIRILKLISGRKLRIRPAGYIYRKSGYPVNLPSLVVPSLHFTCNETYLAINENINGVKDWQTLWRSCRALWRPRSPPATWTPGPPSLNYR